MTNERYYSNIVFIYYLHLFYQGWKTFKQKDDEIDDKDASYFDWDT